jgi:hypothetical protein
MRSIRSATHPVAISCLLLCTLVAAPAAFAGFTPIQPPHPGEDSHRMILNQIYGGNFQQVGTVDFSNGVILAKRVDDILAPNSGPGGPTEMGGPTGGEDDTDQTWRAQFTNARAEAKFAEFEQNFGFFPGASGGSYQQLFNVTGDGYGVTGEAILPLLPNQTIRWGRGGENRIVSSRNADNADREDHMVTYQILFEDIGTEGDEPVFRWLVLWEDILRGEPFEDFDFNDLAVEITAIPEPTSTVAMGALALLAMRRRR